MTDRKITRVNLATYGIGDWPETLDELIAELTELRQSVPEEYRAAIKIEADYDGSEFGSGWVNIYYERPETDEEMVKRIAKEQRRAEESMARDRAQYKRLKKRFEG